jgi:hypothetical protein
VALGIRLGGLLDWVRAQAHHMLDQPNNLPSVAFISTVYHYLKKYVAFIYVFLVF